MREAAHVSGKGDFLFPFIMDLVSEERKNVLQIIMSASEVPEASEPWHGWESYPANLSPSICSPFVYDLDSIGERLTADSSRLFITGDWIRIHVIEVGVKGGYLILERIFTAG